MDAKVAANGGGEARDGEADAAASARSQLGVAGRVRTLTEL